ncbi:hypothetical protein SS50377_27914 [Spironucleus salmonicida]|uniref:Uncharacterized protein n=1 Tax=Spironucleus salmonicida TaxID=348837 RepID=A0A9P8RUP8_9EUKA|nr:hypothetical protein SS50377_27914 [Spironucleus salmonicida]
MMIQSIEEQTRLVDAILASDSVPIDIDLARLFRSIRTHKNIEALRKLLCHPVYNIYKRANTLAKVFKTQFAGELAAATRPPVLFAQAMDQGEFAKAYDLFSQNDFSKLVIGKAQINKSQLVGDVIFQLFQADAKVFRAEAELAASGATTSHESATRMVNYFKFLTSNSKHIQLARFTAVYDSVKLEHEWLVDMKVPSKKIVETFKMLQAGKLARYTYDADDTISAKLYKLDILNEFSIVESGDVGHNIKKFLCRVDLLDHYSPDQIEYLHDDQRHYIAAKKYGCDQAARMVYFQSLSGQSSDITLDPHALRQLRARMTGEPKASLQTVMDALLFPGSAEKLEQVPLIQEKAEHVVEYALFNKKSRFFNSDQRYSAVTAYLAAGYIHKDLNLLSRAARYFMLAVQQTSVAQEKLLLLQAAPLSKVVCLFVALCAELKQALAPHLQRLVGPLSALYRATADAKPLVTGLPSTIFELLITFHSVNDIPAEMSLQVCEFLRALQQEIVGLQYSHAKVSATVPALISDQLKFDQAHVSITENGVTALFSLAQYARRSTKAQLQDAIIQRIDASANYQHTFFSWVMDVVDRLGKKMLDIQLIKQKTDAQTLDATLIRKLLATITISPVIGFQASEDKRVRDLEKNLARKSYMPAQIYQQYVSNAFAARINFDVVTSEPATMTCVKINVDMIQRLVDRFVQMVGMYDTSRVDLPIQGMLNFHTLAVRLLTISGRMYETGIASHAQLLAVVTQQAKSLQKLVPIKLDCQEHYQAFYEQLFSKKAIKTELNILPFLKQIQVTANMTTASNSLALLHAMMNFFQFTSMAVHVSQRMSNQLRVDPKADITILFEQPMPMSVLKALIKVFFSQKNVSSAYISKLYIRSSTDAKQFILLHFYEKAMVEPQYEQIFLDLLKNNCQKSADAMLLFFGKVYNNENLNFNLRVFDAMAELQKAPTPYLLNYAGCLGRKLAISDQAAFDLFCQFSQDDKQAPHSVDYLLQLENSGELIMREFARISYKHACGSAQSRVVYSAIYQTLSQPLQTLFNAEMYAKNAAKLLFAILEYLTASRCSHFPFCSSIPLSTFTPSQLEAYAVFSVFFSLVTPDGLSLAQLNLAGTSQYCQLYYQIQCKVDVTDEQMAGLSHLERVQLVGIQSRK